MTTQEFLDELRTRVADGRVANIESHLHKQNMNRLSATKELNTPARWEKIEVYGRYGAIYVKKD